MTRFSRPAASLGLVASLGTSLGLVALGCDPGAVTPRPDGSSAPTDASTTVDAATDAGPIDPDVDAALPEGVDGGPGTDAASIDAAVPPRPFTGWADFDDGSDGARVYVPTTGVEPLPAIVMLHGCTQTADDFAAATGAEAFAEAHGVVVVFPQQSLLANAYRCWSWFSTDEQTGAAPEVARIVAHAEALPSMAAVDPARIYVAGMSSGGAMATIVAARHPELFAGLAVHSGIAFAGATSSTGAINTQLFGISDVDASAAAAYAAMGSSARLLPVIVFHGTPDTTVATINGDQLAAQWLGTDDLVDDGEANDSLGLTATSESATLEGRSVTIERSAASDGSVYVEHWTIAGIGHAWSGGTVGMAYAASGPSAFEALWSYFTERAPR